MTPGARAQASIDIIDQILSAWQQPKRIPVDKLLERYFKSHRYIGSKDRGAISELVYWCLRYRAGIEWWLEKLNQRQHGRSYIFAALLLRGDCTRDSIQSYTKDSQYSPPPFDEYEQEMIAKLSGQRAQHPDMPDAVRLNYPQWMDGRLREAFGDQFEQAMLAMNEQAHTDLRVNTLKTTREQLIDDLKKEGFEATATALSHTGVRLVKRGPVFTTQAFKSGHFEMQDEGSQALALLVDAQPGHRIIDFCAGAGGKTLAMAASMQNKGRILAWDTSEKRLSQIVPRIRRAGVDNIQTHVLESENDAFIKRHKGTADRVLVDAPCSGSGTWRRNPDLKWCFTQHDLDEVVAVQQSILQSAARLVKKGGRLIYATCSMLKDENESQIDKLLKSSNNFRVVCAKKIWDKKATENSDPHDVSFFSVTPHEDGVDGFFAAVLERVQD